MQRRGSTSDSALRQRLVEKIVFTLKLNKHQRRHGKISERAFQENRGLALRNPKQSASGTGTPSLQMEILIFFLNLILSTLVKGTYNMI